MTLAVVSGLDVTSPRGVMMDGVWTDKVVNISSVSADNGITLAAKHHRGGKEQAVRANDVLSLFVTGCPASTSLPLSTS